MDYPIKLVNKIRNRLQNFILNDLFINKKEEHFFIETSSPLYFQRSSCYRRPAIPSDVRKV